MAETDGEASSAMAMLGPVYYMECPQEELADLDLHIHDDKLIIGDDLPGAADSPRLDAGVQQPAPAGAGRSLLASGGAFVAAPPDASMLLPGGGHPWFWQVPQLHLQQPQPPQYHFQQPGMPSAPPASEGPGAGATSGGDAGGDAAPAGGDGAVGDGGGAAAAAPAPYADAPAARLLVVNAGMCLAPGDAARLTLEVLKKLGDQLAVADPDNPEPPIKLRNQLRWFAASCGCSPGAQQPLASLVAARWTLGDGQGDAVVGEAAFHASVEQSFEALLSQQLSRDPSLLQDEDRLAEAAHDADNRAKLEAMAAAAGLQAPAFAEWCAAHGSGDQARLAAERGARAARRHWIRDRLLGTGGWAGLSGSAIGQQVQPPQPPQPQAPPQPMQPQPPQQGQQAQRRRRTAADVVRAALAKAGVAPAPPPAPLHGPANDTSRADAAAAAAAAAARAARPDAPDGAALESAWRLRIEQAADDVTRGAVLDAAVDEILAFLEAGGKLPKPVGPRPGKLPEQQLERVILGLGRPRGGGGGGGGDAGAGGSGGTAGNSGAGGEAADGGSSGGPGASSVQQAPPPSLSPGAAASEDRL
ncbi:hypothetical protein Rsub_04271 [Raphidocelis subcapitata]|uniref:Uncharacterized protein n=1 Tax=Raphidocelis subcapitata TaxID=307507 RepID=A0A2V0NV90_9CHLO|nr:hypothetical protein Rsub_04271 [Raphidocelis subcapitata]|eukprot:GBF91531.1 hypothetical protein Rsub_04271 [Raphidocelis subcapitata]